MLGSEDHLMKQEVKDIMVSNNHAKLKTTIQDLIQKQEFKKVEKELNDWSEEDIEKLDKSITFTFDKEEHLNELMKIDEVKEADEIDEEEEEEDIFVNLEDLDEGESSEREEASVIENQKVTLISMEKDFNSDSEIKNEKTVSNSKKENKLNNQKNLFAFWKK